MNEATVMITTIDNPYNPFTNFDEWNMFDVEKGYYTCNYLARIVQLSDDMTEKEEDAEIERAIDEIIEYNPIPIYKKIYNDARKHS